ncbi:MAG: mshA 2 [Cellulosimicrobium sp.]|jgi:UDP-glucose:(heptosyl)LPS alpha-1,3-glucosyltransferase|nr:mshA 2 [Cellulosimicrobium sp.]
MRILQIVPTIGPGTGVGAVAHHLEEEWLRRGATVERFTLEDARGGWLPEPGPGLRGKLVLVARVVWFSTVGTVLARRAARRPDTVSICHNDALAGDVYVNHGILQAAMRSRGRYALRMLRNPVHLFIAARDRWRYSHRTHRVVVDLVTEEDAALRRTYPRLAVPTVVIGNGVDVRRYRPPTPRERTDARTALGVEDARTVVVFVGHEFDRKGLPQVLAALARLDDGTHLVVAGGTADMVAAVQHEAAVRGIAQRVHLLGRTPDPRQALHAADVLALPSAYESYGLVVLEALACGVPVVATPVGCVPDVVEAGRTGHVTPAEPEAIAAAVRDLAGRDREALARAARETAEQHSWTAVADRYLKLFERLEGTPR